MRNYRERTFKGEDVIVNVDDSYRMDIFMERSFYRSAVVFGVYQRESFPRFCFANCLPVNKNGALENVIRVSGRVDASPHIKVGLLSDEHWREAFFRVFIVREATGIMVWLCILYPRFQCGEGRCARGGDESSYFRSRYIWVGIRG